MFGPYITDGKKNTKTKDRPSKLTAENYKNSMVDQLADEVEKAVVSLENEV